MTARRDHYLRFSATHWVGVATAPCPLNRVKLQAILASRDHESLTGRCFFLGLVLDEREGRLPAFVVARSRAWRHASGLMSPVKASAHTWTWDRSCLFRSSRS